jgi:hypothetical protein
MHRQQISPLDADPWVEDVAWVFIKIPGNWDIAIPTKIIGRAEKDLVRLSMAGQVVLPLFINGENNAFQLNHFKLLKLRLMWMSR